MIKFLHRKQIDTLRWDDVIANSAAETIYAYSWYLDAAADNWSALVMEDYRFVMPLVWRKRFGIKYAYHPDYVQQLGVFSKEYVDPMIIKMFLHEIPPGLRYGNLRFNTANLVGEEVHFEVTDRMNYELHLDRDYQTLFNAYSTNTKRNLKKALDLKQEFKMDVLLDELIQLKKETNISDKSEAHIKWMTHLFTTLLNHGEGEVIGTRDNGKLQAAALFAFSRTRAVYVLSASSDAGKETRAMFGIVDQFIRQHAGSGRILDFEGSNIPSIARFFKGFGADPKVYQAVDFARFPVSLIKQSKNG